MVVGAEKFSAGEWSQKALARLMQDNLPPTPRNYAVYYHYFSAENSEMNAAFDAIVAKDKMTQFQCDQLYDKYIFTDKELAFLNDASALIDNELKKVMNVIGASAKGTTNFGENLHLFSGKLNKAYSIDAIRDAVGKITEETRMVAAQNNKLQGELQAATAQLSEIRNDFDRVHRESQIDPLTEVGNRKFFDREIERVIRETREQHTVMSLLMIDIDYFKKFNDTHGHLVGDQVLRLVAHTLVENLKGRDVIARFGGEEFVIVLPQTRLKDAERVANLLRINLASKQIKKRGTNETLGAVTISVGATEYIFGEEVNSMIARADAALYQAKQTGRNKVVFAEVKSAAS